ncbi:1,2-phenylacetyl-CoA epoxidase subunit PaaC [Halogranum rubrum]|uniref:Phenylacetate-CoA oxygenase, PaaI subunit n=1 Tax=Halogranum salarium B-1 TaxID=1210908 RepID=J2ZK16_9EURY|nr:1,2-phenylacetyl-CoA epoxidase subunit PaaC [Halogranum salarium]EJN61060.1 phenylacetate-CoA oxygenase, PaaI subunit [Halogranum salarium B-1]
MSLDGPDSLSDSEREAVEELLFRMADDEYVAAERYIEWQIFAPTLESDLALSNIAQDEFGHARLWYDLLQDMGYSEQECIWERDPATWTHSTLVEQPFEEGDWADAILRSYLYDTAENLRMEALVDSTYPPIADRVAKVLAEERYHREHAQSWLERLTGGEHHEKVQAAVDRLFPYALTLFAAGPNEDAIVELGLRTENLDDLREEWLEIVVPFLESLDLTVPEPDEVALPEETGRDASHTDAWFDLYEDFTHTYNELELEEPIRLRGEG